MNLASRHPVHSNCTSRGDLTWIYRRELDLGLDSIGLAPRCRTLQYNHLSIWSTGPRDRQSEITTECYRCAPQQERNRLTHRIRRSPSALGDEGLGPISLSFYMTRAQHQSRRLENSIRLTESSDLFALYTVSMARNIVSNSLGGKLVRDHAEATRRMITARIST